MLLNDESLSKLKSPVSTMNLKALDDMDSSLLMSVLEKKGTYVES